MLQLPMCRDTGTNYLIDGYYAPNLLLLALKQDTDLFP